MLGDDNHLPLELLQIIGDYMHLIDLGRSLSLEEMGAEAVVREAHALNAAQWPHGSWDEVQERDQRERAIILQLRPRLPN